MSHEHHDNQGGGEHQHSHREHHAHMMQDFKPRFFISLALAVALEKQSEHPIGAGTDVAMETADVVLVHSGPHHVLHTRRLAHANHRKTLQNLGWAAGYNIVAIPLAAGVLAWAGIILSPAVGALLMSLSTVIVAINARLMHMPGRTAQA